MYDFFFRAIAEDKNVDPMFRALMAPAVATRGSDRWQEVRAEERADEQREERQQAIARGE